MNVKFKMPHFGRKLSGGSMLKELLLTILATTISIVLTFGTAGWMEKRKQEAYGRQLAYMTIHDMDNTINSLKKYVKEENNSFLQAQYLLEHLDMLDNISGDTLNTVLIYVLSYDELFVLDESSEKIFLSSQEAWSNVNNITFIDMVQSFYSDRHYMFNYLNTSLQWRKPVSEKEFMQRQIDSPGYSLDYVSYLKELLQRDDVCYYIACSPLRQHRINTLIDQWQKKSDECKFMMGISDSELLEYVTSSQQKGKQLTESQLIGVWHGRDKGDDINSERENHIEFLKDHTAILTVIFYRSTPFYSGRIASKNIVPVTWELKGDTLYFNQQPKIECLLDTTGISYRAEMKPYVDNIIEEIEESHRVQKEFTLQQGVIPISYFISIDPSESKIEMRKSGEDEDGTETVTIKYFTKEKK